MKSEIAVVGMGGMFPGAMDLSEYWSNILSARDCTINIPNTYWDLSEFYDPNPLARDKTYGYRAGLINYANFNSIEFGIPPRIMESIAVDQLFALLVAKQALLDAGVIGEGAKKFNNEKAGVILSACVGKSSYMLSHRQTQNVEAIMKSSHVPQYLIDRVVERMLDGTIEWNEASNPGYLPNVVAGRVANRFDLNGTNCVVDAACAGSLAALKMSISELQSGDCDLVLTGGVMIDTTPFTFIAFSKTPAISPANISRPFDNDSDGMLLGDGIGMVVIKRLEDAERDNDHIYGIIESLSSSSDGKAKSIFAPRKEGQTFALDRAYKDTNIDPASLGLIEAHGTGTSIGDTCELESLNEFVKPLAMPKKRIALGSVKSQIGHTRLAAGAASIIKILFALDQKTLPPTANVTTPNTQLKDSPFYLSDKARPWIVNSLKPIRRAGISGFGFGGTNFHAVLRENTLKNIKKFKRRKLSPVALVFSAPTKAELIENLKSTLADLKKPEIAKASFNKAAQQINKPIDDSWARIGMVCIDDEQAIDTIVKALGILSSNDLENWHKNDIYYSAKALAGKGAKVALLFPGQGSQYAGMLTEASIAYPELKEAFTIADNALIAQGKEPVSEVAFPRLFPAEKPTAHEAAIQQTENAQLSLAAAGLGLYQILMNRGLNADFLAGHSFGELTALYASGAMSAEDLMELSAKRAMAMDEAQKQNPGTMMAIGASWDEVTKIIEGNNGVFIANENSPRQTVVSGSTEAIDELEKELTKKSIFAKKLSVSGAFHSQHMEPAKESFSEALYAISFSEFDTQVYSNVTGKPYENPSDVAGALANQLVSPVRFAASINDMYEKGTFLFIEVGPGRVLASLADQVLEGKPHAVISLNPDKKQDSTYALELAAAQIKVLGANISSDPYALALNEVYEPPADNKRTYALPPLHFLLPDTQQKIFDAMYKEDPPLPPGSLGEGWPPAPPEAKALEKPVEKAAIEAPKPAASAKETAAEKSEPQQVIQAEQKVELKKEQKPTEARPKAGKQIEVPAEAIEITEIEKGKIIMDNGDTLPILDSAYGLQALNKEMFTQFTQSQGLQLDKFKEIIETSGEAVEQNLGGLLQFMELFQSNSIQAYSAYFEEQSRIIASGGETQLTAPQPIKKASQSSRASFTFNTSQPSEPPQLPEIKEETPIPPSVLKAELSEKAVQPQAEAPKPAKPAPAPVAPAPVKAEVKPAPVAPAPVAVQEPVMVEAFDDVTGELVEAEVVGSNSIFVMGVTKGQIEERIIEVISDRTGYPIEMIEPDMNIESDLGIDSIRRVEIFSVLNDEIERGFTQADVETMASLYTIDEFSEFLADKLNSEPDENEETVHFDSETINSFLASGQVPEGMEIPESYREMAEAYQQQQVIEAPEANDEDAEEVETEIIEPNDRLNDDDLLPSMPDAAIKRYDIYLKELTHPDGIATPVVATGGIVIISKDKEGVADLVSDELSRRGYKTAMMSMDWNEAADAELSLSEPSEKAIRAIYENVEKEYGDAPVGFIHIASPRFTDKDVLAIFDEAESKSLEAVFLFAKLFESKCSTPATGKPFFMAVSRIDGMHGKGVDWNGASIQAGYAGMLKTAYREFKKAWAKSIDVAHETTPQLTAELIIEEIFASDEDVFEVARDSIGNRYINSLKENNDLEAAEFIPTADDVFFVTGGARGVTFRSALKMGLEYKSKMALVGHSRIDQDLTWMNGETEIAKLRPIIIEKLREEGTTPQPKIIDSTIKEALNQLEVVKNLEIAKKKGVEAIYICADVRDEDSVKAAVKETIEKFGTITGIIYGAGAIADKDFNKKTSQDFHTVYDTKIIGLQNCLKSIQLRDVKFFAVFSSAAAYFGNEKQADYTMSNEILNKFVNEYRKAYPKAFAMAINWGPWEGGMVTVALKNILIARNIDMVPYDQGTRLFAEQFRYRLKEGHSQFLLHSTDQYIEHFGSI